MKCFFYLELDHKSNKYPNQRQAQFMEGEIEDHTTKEPPLNNIDIKDIHGNEGKVLTCILEKLY